MSENGEKNVILGLDISTSCIGISIVYDDGVNEPEILKMTHIVPKIPSKKTGIEALILRKEIFERDFLTTITGIGITECVIEAPLKYASASSNAQAVAQLLQFNGLLSEAVYRVLKIVPTYISSYDARMQSFPELLSIRKFNKRGEQYTYKHIEDAIKKNHLILFGDFPFDCDKKFIMLNCVRDKYPDINWVYNSKGEMKKENYDANDSLICVLAHINTKRYGELVPTIKEYTKEVLENGDTVVNYIMDIWGKEYKKKIIINKE